MNDALTTMGTLLRTAAVLSVLAIPLQTVHAHGTEARYVEIMKWDKPNFSQIFASNRSHLEGMPSNWVEATPSVQQIDGKSCLVGQLFGFNVDDKYAFDIDEQVKLTLTYAAEYTTPFIVGWDKNGGNGAGITELKPEKNSKFVTLTLPLDRARFAGQATQGADIAMSAKGLGSMAICDIQVERSNTTKAATEFGSVQLVLKDEKTGGSIPARVTAADELALNRLS